MYNDGRNSDDLVLGLGVLKIDGRDVGYMREDLTLSRAPDIFDYEADVPKALVKRWVIRDPISLAGTLDQINGDNINDVIGSGSVDRVTVPGSERVALNPLAELTEHALEFVYTHPDLRTITLRIWKASSDGSFEWAFRSEDISQLPFTFNALKDTSKTVAEGQYGEIVMEMSSS